MWMAQHGNSMIRDFKFASSFVNNKRIRRSWEFSSAFARVCVCVFVRVLLTVRAVVGQQRLWPIDGFHVLRSRGLLLVFVFEQKRQGIFVVVIVVVGSESSR